MPYINDWERVMELGCGSGRITMGILRYFFDKIDIVDIALSTLTEIWRENKKNLNNRARNK